MSLFSCHWRLPVDRNVVGWTVDDMNSHLVSISDLNRRPWELPIHHSDQYLLAQARHLCLAHLHVPTNQVFVRGLLVVILVDTINGKEMDQIKARKASPYLLRMCARRMPRTPPVVRRRRGKQWRRPAPWRSPLRWGGSSGHPCSPWLLTFLCEVLSMGCCRSECFAR